MQLNVASYGMESVLEKRQEQTSNLKTTDINLRKRKRQNEERPYGCTICGPGEPRFYAENSSWKKHEKEHERTYQCLLHKMVHSVGEGEVCTLCGLLNPDEVHICSHRVEACLSAQRAPLEFKRRYQLVSHLDSQHACTSSKSLVDEWWKPSPKRGWSCGFCVALFESITSRLQHIQLKHYDKGQRLSEWNPNNIIKGLLQQPMINEAWHAILDNKDAYTRQNPRWALDDIPDLQRRLELGAVTNEAAQDLALIVWGHVKFDHISLLATSSNAYDHISLTAPTLLPITSDNERLLDRRSFIPPSRLDLVLPGQGFPRAQSETGSCEHLEAVSRLTPDNIDSLSECVAHPLSIEDHWSGDYVRNSGGLATPISDINSGNHFQRSQPSTSDVAGMTGDDYIFDAVTEDWSQDNIGNLNSDSVLREQGNWVDNA